VARFVDFEVFEDRSVAGFEKPLRHFNGKILVGLGRFDSFDPEGKVSSFAYLIITRA